MTDTVRVLSGEATVTYDGAESREEHGHLLAIVKPDNTVIHDAAGYRPVAWLTRAESVAVEPDRIVARDGDERVRVHVHEVHADGRYPAGEAGAPVGPCPDCGAALVDAGGRVVCTGTDCTREHSTPRDATVIGDPCDCGLPRVRVERGAAFEVCVDRACEPLDAAVRERFDRAFDCPDCGADLRVLRRGGLILGCERYPDCETGFALPAGTRDGTCACGLPAFAVDGERRCLDARCERASTGAATSDRGADGGAPP